MVPLSPWRISQAATTRLHMREYIGIERIVKKSTQIWALSQIRRKRLVGSSSIG